MNTSASSPSVPRSHSLQSDDDATFLVFSWTRDRYAHSIFRSEHQPTTVDGSLVFNTRPPIIWSSVEGTPEETWPASPSLQQLSTEIIDEIPTILGVGASGTSHYSLCARYVDEEKCWLFEWAVRLSKRIVDNSSHRFADLHNLTCQSEGRLWMNRYRRTEIFQRSSASPSRIEPGRQTVVDQNADATEINVGIPPSLESRTISWSYKIFD